MAPIKQTVAFIHIPKTAGSTVRKLVQLHYGDAVVFRTQAEYRAAAPAIRAGELDRAGAYMGHMPYGLHELLGQALAYFTFVRHPVARIASLYAYLLTHTGNDFHHFARVPFDEFATTHEPPELDAKLCNLMTNMLAGRGPGDDDRAHAQDQALLERALTHAESMVAIGVQERFDNSLAVLSARLGWRLPTYRVHNRSQSQKDAGVAPGAEAVDAILERNRLDLALYEWAEQRLEAEIAELRVRSLAVRLINHDRLRGARRLLRRLRLVA